MLLVCHGGSEESEFRGGTREAAKAGEVLEAVADASCLGSGFESQEVCGKVSIGVSAQ